MSPPPEGFQPNPFSANRQRPEEEERSRKMLSKDSLLDSLDLAILNLWCSGMEKIVVSKMDEKGSLKYGKAEPD